MKQEFSSLLFIYYYKILSPSCDETRQKLSWYILFASQPTTPIAVALSWYILSPSPASVVLPIAIGSPPFCSCGSPATLRLLPVRFHPSVVEKTSEKLSLTVY